MEKYNFIIWLKSGECVEGIGEERIINMIKEKFKEHEGGKKVISFLDSEGETYIDLDRVEAIGTTKCIELGTVGFK